MHRPICRCGYGFSAIYHLTQTKQGISSIELGRRLGVTQTTAWKIKHKLKQVMLERDATKRLTGRVEIDDAYLGGERSGGKQDQGAPGKTPFVAAVETTAEGKAGSPEAAPCHQLLRKLDRRVRQAQPRSKLLCRQRWPSVFHQRRRRRVCAPSRQDRVRTKSGSDASLQWVNTALGNIKAAITGTYRAINSKHVPRYLAEFEYRFNRRYDLAAMIPRLTWAAVRTIPMPYRLLKLAEVHA